MTEIILTCCDYCNPECNEHPIDGRGVVVASEKVCISDFGWIRTPQGIKCQQCQDDEMGNNFVTDVRLKGSIGVAGSNPKCSITISSISRNASRYEMTSWEESDVDEYYRKHSDLARANIKTISGNSPTVSKKAGLASGKGNLSGGHKYRAIS